MNYKMNICVLKVLNRSWHAANKSFEVIKVYAQPFLIVYQNYLLFVESYNEVGHHFVACKHLLIYNVEKCVDSALLKHLT